MRVKRQKCKTPFEEMGETRLKIEGVEFRLYVNWIKDSAQEIRPGRKSTPIPMYYYYVSLRRFPR